MIMFYNKAYVLDLWLDISAIHTACFKYLSG